MTDTQILSIAIMVVTVLTGALFNNFRINDMRDAFRDTLRAEMTAVRHGVSEPSWAAKPERRFDPSACEVKTPAVKTP